MSDCRTFQDLIAEYLDGTLDSGRMSQLRAHTEACEVCAREFRRAAMMREVVGDAMGPRMTAEQAREAILANLADRAERPTLQIHTGGLRLPQTRLAVAAAVLLAVGAVAGFALARLKPARPVDAPSFTLVPVQVAALNGTVLVRHDGSDTWKTMTGDSPVCLGDTFHSMGGSGLTLALPDKSEIEVAENSMLSLTSYNGETRFHLEHGHCRASLENPHGPFFISTPHGRVEALGTEFTVTVE